MNVCFYTTTYKSQPLNRVQLNIGYLGAYLKHHRPDVKVTYALTHEQAVVSKPDILCVSSTSQVIDDGIELARKVPGSRKVLGGYHVSALPHLLPEEFDVGVIGEGEATLLDLVNDDDWSVILGTIGNPLRPRLDVTTLPFPYRDRNGCGSEYMFTSRGCPYSCIYCASSKKWGRVSMMSAERVVEEMSVLYHEYKAQHITMFDDLFASNIARLQQIADFMESAKLIGKMTFHGFVRANLVTDAMVRVLKHIGFTSVRFGAETMGSDLLKFLKGGNVTPDDARRTVNLFSKHKIKVGASIVLGSPGETESDLQATYDFLVKNNGKVHVSGFYLLTPYPGTQLWNMALEKGLVSETMSWERLSLDFLKPEFDWNQAVYMNEQSIPLSRFKQIVAKFKKTFLPHV